MEKTKWIGIFLFGMIFFLNGHVLLAVEKENSQETLPQIHIKGIEIKGNKKIESSTIRGKLDINEGDKYSPEKIRNEIKNLYRLGFFEDIKFETEGFEGGIKLFIIVSEKPILKDVSYIGNEKIKKETLKEKVYIKKDTFIDLAQIKSYQEKLIQYYKGEGYYNVEIVPVIEKLENNQTSLVFSIKEGTKTKIKSVQFEGNHVFNDKKLKSIIESKEFFWLTSWLTDRGVYKAEEAQNDSERIKELYLNNGYLTVQAGAPELTLTPDKKWFNLKFIISEGPQFSIRKINFSGNTLFPSEELLKKINTREGEIFKRDVLRQDINTLTDLYGERGYAFLNITPQFVTDNASKTVELTLEISEGNLTYIRKINISGNEKTRDKVIRREIRLDEQGLFNTKSLKRSYERIRNLNFYENIEISPERVSENLMDLNVKVKEKSTGQISLGGGYSSVDHLIGMFEINEGNFLGRGYLLKTKAQLGGRSTIYDITFRDPYINDLPISGSINLFRVEQNFVSYKERKVGGNLVLGKSFGEYTSGSLSYTLQYVDFFDVLTTSSQRIQDISTSGQTVTSSLGLGIARDTRDFIFDPSKGSRNSLSLTFAGPELGGNTQFYKVVLDSSRYFPLIWNTVFSLHGETGYIHEIKGSATLFEGFIVGGLNTLRGFDYGKAGPVGPAGEIIPASKLLLFNAELMFPLVTEAKIKGVFFFDGGRGFDLGEVVSVDKLRYGAGFGIRWVIPQLGPIRFEWSRNLFPRETEESSRFDFSIGSVF
ncbi:MAG: outer membrane protein assembly factor BamA [Nitrospirae bacterium]|nr:outer membrane protein assembly factor BamA [Nitrospirota bacterium]